MDKKRILSGIKPTGNLTLGNYIGAIKNWVALQDEYECFYMLADLHSLTVRNNPEELKQSSLSVLAYYIAAGIDPNKNAMFIQSHVKEHAELAWILNCYTYMGELSRMTQFKDKSAKQGENINAGLYTYPVLMAADILMYQADLVPVGHDQKQHVEITRDIGERFNKIYGNTFKIPSPYISKVGARIMGLQEPQGKMGKSNESINDSIYLKDDEATIMKKFKKAVTDSEGIVRLAEEKPGVSNLMSIYSCITGKTVEQIENEFAGVGYGVFKETVGQSVVEALKPLQQRYNEIMSEPAYLEKIYIEGAKKAREIADITLIDVKKKVGLICL